MADFPDYKTAQIDSLSPYIRNSRTHSDEQVAQIAASGYRKQRQCGIRSMQATTAYRIKEALSATA